MSDFSPERQQSQASKLWRKLRWFLLVIGILLAALGVFLIGLWYYHPKLIYAPVDHSVHPEKKLLERHPSLKPQLLDLKSKDDTKIRGYWFEHPRAAKSAKKLTTILYLHGNAGKLDNLFEHIKAMRQHVPANIMLISYRGYGYSEGVPSMKGIRMDSQTALDHVTSSPQVDLAKIVIYGHSLGGSVALHLIADNWRKVKSAIIENTFLSIPKMASHSRPYLAWATFVVTEDWNTEKQIERLKEDAENNMKTPFTDILLVSGMKDSTVPPYHGEALWEKLKEIKVVRKDVLIERVVFNDCHHDCIKVNGYFEHFEKFYQKSTGDQILTPSGGQLS